MTAKFALTQINRSNEWQRVSFTALNSENPAEKEEVHDNYSDYMSRYEGKGWQDFPTCS